MCVRDQIKIHLVETYDALYKFDIVVISESMLDQAVKYEAIYIEGLSKEIYCSDHPSNTKTGAMCLYFRKGLLIKRRADLEQFFLVGYVEERLWWPIQSPNKGKKKKASS